MSHPLDDYITYRVSKSKDSLRDAKILAGSGSWNACVNRLYYACYYIVSALLLKNGFSAKTHSGIKSLFNNHFVKTGKVTLEEGKLYSDLMDWRQKGDYGDMFDFDKETVEPLIIMVSSFLETIGKLIAS